MPNIADESQVKEAGKKSKLARKEEIEDLRSILSQPEGKRFIWRMLDDCGVFRSVWHPSALIHFNEGRRDVGLKLLHDINESKPDVLIEMMKKLQEEKINE